MTWEKGMDSQQEVSPPSASWRSRDISAIPLKISLEPISLLSVHSGCTRAASSMGASPEPVGSLIWSEKVNGFSCTAHSR